MLSEVSVTPRASSPLHFLPKDKQRNVSCVFILSLSLEKRTNAMGTEFLWTYKWNKCTE